MLTYLRSEENAIKRAANYDQNQSSSSSNSKIEAREAEPTTGADIDTSVKSGRPVRRENLELKFDLSPRVQSIPIARSEDEFSSAVEETTAGKLVVRDDEQPATTKWASVETRKLSKEERAKQMINSINYLNFILSDNTEQTNQQHLQELQEAQHEPGQQNANEEGVASGAKSERMVNGEELDDLNAVYVEDDLSMVNASFKLLDTKMSENALDDTKQLTSEEQFNQAFLMNVSGNGFTLFMLPSEKLVDESLNCI